ncbi:zinc finger protein ZFP2-like [Branchiostoma lanceolatum]|uniref:zinc finger protein ZFP2-like n=1 Tax=Branchiostoma lanceolatum TaxID=7740 RepID=UPI0034538B56
MEAAGAQSKLPTDADDSTMTAEPPTVIPEQCSAGPGSGSVIIKCKSDAITLHQPSIGCEPDDRTDVRISQFKRALNREITENNNVVSTLQADIPNGVHTRIKPDIHCVATHFSTINFNKQHFKKARLLHLNVDMRRDDDGEKLGSPQPNCQHCPQCVSHIRYDLKRHLATQEKTASQTQSPSTETDPVVEGDTGVKIQLHPDSTKNGGGFRTDFPTMANDAQTTCVETNSEVDSDVRRDEESEDLREEGAVQRFVCVLCNFATHNKTALQFHMKAHEGEPGPFRCRLCEFVAMTTTHMGGHWRQHVKSATSFRCDRCDFKSKSQRRLDVHLRRQHTEGRAKCSFCAFSADTERGLNIHVRRRHLNPDPDDLERERNDDITNHLEKHGKVGLLQCPVCDYITKWKKNLSKHLSEVHKTHNFVNKCPDCEQTFRTVSLLRLHVRRKHTGERPFKCPHCDYAALVSSHLERHILRHTGDRPFMCEECGYMAMTKDLLTNHRRTHSGEKPYRCELCGYAASRRHHLQGHMAKHAPVKPDRRFKCEFCDYAAVRKFHLVRHVTRHTGEKPFKCNMCEYSTVDNSRLQTHIRAHTGEKPFRCSNCDFATARKDHLKQHMTSRHKQTNIQNK